MSKSLISCLLSCLLPLFVAAQRMPAYPLITHGPDFNIWSCTDTLSNDATRSWNGEAQPLIGLLRINGKTYRFIGKPDERAAKAEIPALPMKGERPEHGPFTTFYTYELDSLTLFVVFRSPQLPTDLPLLSRPLSYIEITGISRANTPRKIEIYLGASSDIAVQDAAQKVRAEVVGVPGLKAMRVGTVEQPMLKRSGDAIRQDWGFLYVGAADSAVQTVSSMADALSGFVQKGEIKNSPKENKSLVINTILKFSTASSRSFRANFMLAYDEEYAVEYFGEKYRPYWKYEIRGGGAELLQKAWAEHQDIKTRCDAYAVRLREEIEAVGGPAYWSLCERVFRQTMSSFKLVKSPFGETYFLSKSKGAGGYVQDLEELYAASPFLLSLNPRLMRFALDAVYDCVENRKWPKTYPPNDLGVYPLVNGQVRSDSFPAEQCANMLLLTAALCRAEGLDQYAKDHWKTMSVWAEQLLALGLKTGDEKRVFSPNGQVKDDANLSAKVIVALNAYARTSNRIREDKVYEKFGASPILNAVDWADSLAENDHTRLAFGLAGTWSQKEHLVWDKLLKTNLFKLEVKQREADLLRQKMLKFGVPQDSRSSWSKPETTLWAAALSDTPEGFEVLLRPLLSWIDRTPQRAPLPAWIDAQDARPVTGKAGPTLGGFYMGYLMAKWK